MILRATIENLYSFNQETEISFVAGKSGAHPMQVSRAESRDDISVLKTGIIYGANASGKSNIIKAIYLLQKIALKGLPERHIEPFKLCEPNNRLSKVELEFKIGKKYFAYGVEFSIKGISEEWLFEINSRSESEIFSRKVVNTGNNFSFGSFEGKNETRLLLKFISQSTPLTDSFLSEYVKRNGEGLGDINVVHSWMRDNLKIIFPESRFEGLSVRVEKGENFAFATKSLLEYFNTGITDIKRVKVSKEEVELPKDVIIDILKAAKPNTGSMIASVSNSVVYYFETDENGITSIFKQTVFHKSTDGKSIPFEMDEESDGSIRLLDFIPMLIDLRLNDTVFFVDEIDRSMHPMLSQKILEYYFNYLSNSRDTQLIFTTHESNLLNLDLIRADEVWFVEKSSDGSSHLTSLAEYKPRQDIRKGYLQGRYGAIPFFAQLKDLKW